MNAIAERLGSKVDAGALAPTGRSLGRLLLDAGKISPEEGELALRLAKEKDIRFGEACLRLKLVSEEDIERALATQFDFPYVNPDDAAFSAALVAAYRPFNAEVEALRALRTQLLLRWFNEERKLLSIVSPDHGDGRTFLAANLAVVFAQLGERTLLIDADLRSPGQHRMFKLGNVYGLSAMLAGRNGFEDEEHIKGFGNLCVIAAGATPPNPLELVSRGEFRSLLAAKANEFDVVLVDTPAASSSADAQAISARAGGALVVVRENRARLRELERLTESIQRSNAEVVGCVLNRH